jgi:predicted CoA-binding protein
MAMRMLGDYGHQVRLISPRLKSLEGQEVWQSLEALASSNSKIDTVTMYVGAPLSSKMTEQLVALSPKRVIFNPGAENPAIYTMLIAAGIEPVEACTLVLLRTGQF